MDPDISAEIISSPTMTPGSVDPGVTASPAPNDGNVGKKSLKNAKNKPRSLYASKSEGCAPSRLAGNFGGKRPANDNSEQQIAKKSKLGEYGPFRDQYSASLKIYYRPSEYDLAQICEKVDLKFTKMGYEFSTKIEINQITPTMSPSVVHKTKEDEFKGFNCFSLFLTGTEENTPIVRDAINKYIYNNFKTFGKVMGIDFSELNYETPLIKKTIFSRFTTPIHFEIMCQWFECRIAIYDRGIWIKYGNWNEEEFYLPTFLIESDYGKFNPILKLKN
uniref:Uncharacterized protein n=1 Tax=Panagrolaimus superbus TaxID=310955 RepID=A0A914YJQ2_9BILA